jgi:hypothetical protein
MERVRLRHHQAEELIVKAKEQAALRERQAQALRAKGQTIPPEASLLGCWQVIEKTFLYKVDPKMYPDGKLGDYLTFFRFLAPDNYLYGESISSGESFWGPNHGLLYNLDTMTFDITGRVIQEGLVKYRELPNLGKVQTQYNSLGKPFGRYTELPRLLEAHWQGWTMEGKNYSEAGEIEFKAVLIGNKS